MSRNRVLEWELTQIFLCRPEAWYQERGAGVDASGIAGRSFYTSLGHLNETWQVSADMDESGEMKSERRMRL